MQSIEFFALKILTLQSVPLCAEDEKMRGMRKQVGKTFECKYMEVCTTCRQKKCEMSQVLYPHQSYSLPLSATNANKWLEICSAHSCLVYPPNHQLVRFVLDKGHLVQDLLVQ
ncbi:hypothetical protein XENOCAPTIV_005770 [Xenoophorus captivus]|uniref:Uncharacterized protein n=1 Tax=Xenoophorus captivus TaxID=1517983 RepID=A0ABV0RPG9_9TELE